jgi:hypothetical protein
MDIIPRAGPKTPGGSGQPVHLVIGAAARNKRYPWGTKRGFVGGSSPHLHTFCGGSSPLWLNTLTRGSYPVPRGRGRDPVTGPQGRGSRDRLPRSRECYQVTKSPWPPRIRCLGSLCKALIPEDKAVCPERTPRNLGRRTQNAKCASQANFIFGRISTACARRGCWN